MLDIYTQDYIYDLVYRSNYDNVMKQLNGISSSISKLFGFPHRHIEDNECFGLTEQLFLKVLKIEVGIRTELNSREPLTNEQITRIERVFEQ